MTSSSASSDLEDEGIIDLANSMLTQLHVPISVNSVKELKSHIFVTLYEGLCGETLPDVIRSSSSSEDEVHNVQCVIDSLSLDVLHTSMSHINGDDIVAGNKVAILNLLEVFSGLLEYILNKIESDVSSDNETEDADIGAESDPDTISVELIDEALDRGLGNQHVQTFPQWKSDSPPQRGPKALHSTVPSVLSQPVAHSSGRSGLDAPDSTEDLILESEKLERQMLEEDKVVAPPIVSIKKPEPRQQNSILSVEEADSTTTSASFPEPLVHPRDDITLHDDVTDGLVLGQGRRDFQDIGLRPRPEPSMGSDGIDPHSDPRQQTTIGRQTNNAPSTVHHTFTHHLYHHHLDGETDRKFSTSTRDPFTSTLPIATSSTSRDPLAASLPPSSRYVKSERPKSRYKSAPSASATLESSKYRVREPVVQTNIIPSQSQNRSNIPDQSKRRVQSGSMQTDSRFAKDYGTAKTLRKTRDVTSTVPARETVANKARPPKVNVPSEGKFESGADTNRTFDVMQSGDLKVHAQPDSSQMGRPTASRSYDSLFSLVHDTQKMSEAAIQSSPLKSKPRRENEIAEQIAPPIREALHRVDQESHVVHSLSQSLNVPDTDKEISSRIDQARKPSRKVSFLTERSFTKTEKPEIDRIRSPIHRPRREDYMSDLPLRNSLKKYYEKRYPKPHIDSTRQSVHERPSTSLGVHSRRDSWRREREQDQAHSDSELSQHSDSMIDYGDQDLQERLEDLSDEDKEQLQRSKHVKFRETITALSGEYGKIRQKLIEEKRQKERNTKVLGKLFKIDYDNIHEDEMDDLRQQRKTANKKDKEYKKSVLLPTKPPIPRSGRKPQGPRARPTSRLTTAGKTRKRSASSSPIGGRRKPTGPFHVGTDEFLPELLEEFPFLYLSPETLHELWKQHAGQVKTISKVQQEVRRRKSKAQIEIEEAEQRQNILADIMKKEMAHNNRMREAKDRKAQHLSVQSQVREKRQQTAKSKRYYEEYQVRMRSKMLKKRTREEMIFKKLFKDGIEIQKERIRDLRKYANDQRQRRNNKQQNEIESLENYYRDQFALLAESMAKERQEIQIRETAQNKVLNQMKRELRRKMEADIHDFQDQMQRDDDEAYFRQLDADRIRNELYAAKYQHNM
ncbi:unnamed protein product [Owenia fusiformis]|uniref:Uncharacterized protein n=1 Tax=Owenia fusiformis TaxID=6347 RepID=A0A8J1XYB6_OWEFU|nr:unnamed protein product [Owenia fusiformis]